MSGEHQQPGLSGLHRNNPVLLIILRSDDSLLLSHFGEPLHACDALSDLRLKLGQRHMSRRSMRSSIAKIADGPLLTNLSSPGGPFMRVLAHEWGTSAVVFTTRCIPLPPASSTRRRGYFFSIASFRCFAQASAVL